MLEVPAKVENAERCRPRDNLDVSVEASPKADGGEAGGQARYGNGLVEIPPEGQLQIVLVVFARVFLGEEGPSHKRVSSCLIWK